MDILTGLAVPKSSFSLLAGESVVIPIFLIGGNED
jgi:hypothetical protein